MALVFFTLTGSVGAAEIEADAVEVVACGKDEVCIDQFETVTRTGDLLVLEGSETELVRIMFDQSVLYARHVTINDGEDGDRWALLEGAVRVERDGTIITSEQARLEFDDDIYFFERQVHVLEQKEKTREIWSDAMEYHGETGNMTAEGSVRMEEEGRWFRAKRMVYDAEDDQALLEGDVTVVDDKGQISAQRLDISLNDETFTGVGPGRLVLSEIRQSADEEAAE